MEIVRRAFAATERGDWDAWVETLDPEVEWVVPYVDGGTYRERAAVRGWLRQMEQAFEGIQVELVELVERGDRVAERIRTTGGAGSGPAVSQHMNIVFQFRDGLAVRGELFERWGEALAAPDLSA